MEKKSALLVGVGGQGAILTAKVLVNGLMKAGTYAFDADGKMIIRLAGDAAGDYDVDLDDVLALWAYLAGEDVKINLKNADVNADGKVDANDALLIMQYVSGWDVTLK